MYALLTVADGLAKRLCALRHLAPFLAVRITERRRANQVARRDLQHAPMTRRGSRVQRQLNAAAIAAVLAGAVLLCPRASVQLTTREREGGGSLTHSVIPQCPTCAHAQQRNHAQSMRQHFVRQWRSVLLNLDHVNRKRCNVGNHDAA